MNFAVYVWAARFGRLNIDTGTLRVIHLVAKRKERDLDYGHIYTQNGPVQQGYKPTMTQNYLNFITGAGVCVGKTSLSSKPMQT